jgi:hypothetical protein
MVEGTVCLWCKAMCVCGAWHCVVVQGTVCMWWKALCVYGGRHCVSVVQGDVCLWCMALCLWWKALCACGGRHCVYVVLGESLCVCGARQGDVCLWCKAMRCVYVVQGKVLCVCGARREALDRHTKKCATIMILSDASALGVWHTMTKLKLPCTKACAPFPTRTGMSMRRSAKSWWCCCMAPHTRHTMAKSFEVG